MSRPSGAVRRRGMRMRNVAHWGTILSAIAVLVGCNATDEGPPRGTGGAGGGSGGVAGVGGIGGEGGMAGVGGTAGIGGEGGMGGEGGVAGAGGMGGEGGMAGAGGIGGAGGMAGMGGAAGRDCAQSGAVEFVHPTLSSINVSDCITPDVCLTRGLSRGLFNIASSTETQPAGTSPAGTLWAPADCATSMGNEASFVSFRDSLGNAIGDNILTTPLCLWIPDANLFYDVVFSAWESGGGGGFTYTRTAAVPDECAHGDARCDESNACSCPGGFIVDEESGKCRAPSSCDANPCGFGATCRPMGLESHVCSCEVVFFDKPRNDSVTCDSLSPNVCIARGNSRPLYNSADEAGYTFDIDPCESSSPSLTEWASVPCSEATELDFGSFISESYAGCYPGGTIGVQGCVRLTDGSNESWDIMMTQWCGGDNVGGGCFSYIRSHDVADGVNCN